jgi:hypothetical protein
MKKINVITLGCSKNTVDSEHLMAQLAAAGYTVAADSDRTDARVVVVNTCGFIGDAKQESIDMILRAAAAKQAGRIDRLFVVGCLSERYADELRPELPEVDEFFGVKDWEGVVRALGGIPVPTDIRNLGRFHGELLKLSPGNCVVIYPEAHIWPCYTGVRPFRDSSFRYPVETGQPVFAFTVTYRRHLILPLPRTVVYIDGPFFPDSALTLRQNQRKLRDEVYNAMCRRSQKSNFRYHEYVEQTEEA